MLDGVLIGTFALGLLYNTVVQLIKVLGEKLNFAAPAGFYGWLMVGFSVVANFLLVAGPLLGLDLPLIGEYLEQANTLLLQAIVFVGSPFFAWVLRQIQNVSAS